MTSEAELSDAAVSEPDYRRIMSDKALASVSKWTEPIDEDKAEDEVADYRRHTMRKWLFMAVCAVIVVVVMGYALTVGDYHIGFWETYELLWNHINGYVPVENFTKDWVVVQMRLPRIIAGVIAGAGLACCGAVLQSTLLNPLADTYTTGVSSGASFGATISMVAGVTILSGPYALVTNAFIFAMIPVAVIVLTTKKKSSSPTTLIMAGIAIMYIFNALTTALQLRADPDALATIYQWQVGTLTMVDWDDTFVMLLVTAIGLVVMIMLSRSINVLATGDESANSMGVNASRLRIIALVVSTVVTAGIVAFTGPIGFVGLVAPHIVRLFIGADNRYLIPASAIFGSALMVTADLLGRTVIAPAVLEVGVVMAFLGGPMFLWLVMRKNSNVW